MIKNQDTVNKDVVIQYSDNLKSDGLTIPYLFGTKAIGANSTLYAEPFNNCQIGAIASFVNVITLPKEKAEDVLKEIWRYCAKRMVVVDIQRGYEDSLEKLFTSKEIVFKQQYLSSNGSTMTMYLLRMNDMLYRVHQERAEKAKQDNVAKAREVVAV